MARTALGSTWKGWFVVITFWLMSLPSVVRDVESLPGLFGALLGSFGILIILLYLINIRREREESPNPE